MVAVRHGTLDALSATGQCTSQEPPPDRSLLCSTESVRRAGEASGQAPGRSSELQPTALETGDRTPARLRGTGPGVRTTEGTLKPMLENEVNRVAQ